MTLGLDNVALYMLADDRPLISDFSFVLKSTDRIALIGEEGDGKSTLLKFMCGEEKVFDYIRYTGETVRKGKFGYLEQFLSKDYAALTVEKFLADSDIYGAYDYADSLGLDYEFLCSDRIVGSLSGGEKVKLRLFKLLCSRPDALFLDEPSNDLDITTLAFLRDFITQSRIPVVFVSHDEELVSSAANGIIHIEQLSGKVRNKITVARIGYREYVQSRNLLFERQARMAQSERREYKKQTERLRELYEKARNNKSWKNADGIPSSDGHTRQAMQSIVAKRNRIEREKEDFTEIPVREESIITRFDPSISLPSRKRVLELDLPELKIGNKILSHNVSLTVCGADKVCIIGRNGAGKSTLLKEIMRELNGRDDISVGYMPQSYEDALDFSLTPTEFLQASYDKNQLTRAMTYLGNMRFTSREMARPIEKLSGGQKAKLLFLDMVLRRCDVLVLDEPTRNFSPLSAPVIRKALCDFGGAIISVSHDLGYIEEVPNALYELTAEGLKRI